MKKSILFLVLALALMSLSVGCDLFSPQTSKGTIEVSNTYIPPSGYSGCTLYANLDGGTSVIVGNGTIYQFPLASPGSHTVNLSFQPGDQGCNNTCTVSPASDSFQVSGGNLYVVKIAQGANCWNLVVSGP